MSLHPLVCADAALAASQNVQVIELHFEGAAVGTNGVILKLVAAQSVAQHRVHLAVGNGSRDDAKPSAAAVEALIKRPNGNLLSAVEQSIKTGVEKYLGEIQDKDADGNKGIAFAVGGLNVRDVALVELVVGAGATKPALVLSTSLSSAGVVVERIPDACEITAGALKKNDGAALALATSSLVLVGGAVNGSCATVLGAFAIPTALDLEVAVGKRITLRMHCIN
jgi:hypothetical protein